jgi:lipoprotein-releasing system permease protein
MFHPLSVYIGLRYARARSHRFFVSFITWVSLLGVAIGVAALIVVLSVMNGLESELRNRLLALSAPVRITAAPGANPDWQYTAGQVAALGSGTEPYAELQVLAVRQPEMVPLLLRGAGASTVRELEKLLVDGRIAPMQQGQGIVMGSLAAEQLGVAVGDVVTLLVPTVSATAPPDARLREFTVTGLFEAGIQDHDGTLAYVDFPTLVALGAARSGNMGLAVAVADSLAAPAVAARLRAGLAATGAAAVHIIDWTEEHGSYFRAIKIEKTMMALILLLIVAVAAFNIVAMLVMVVTDKRTDIAILRTLGAGPRAVAAVFVTQGLIIGWIGVLAGLLLGVSLARNVGPILGYADRVLGLSLFDADVYYISQVPSELHRMDVALVALSALLVTALATVYPALRAAATSPAEALRYE